MDRPNCRCSGGFLLAEDLLRLLDEDSRPGREAAARPADHQPTYGYLDDSMGVPDLIYRRKRNPP